MDISALNIVTHVERPHPQALSTFRKCASPVHAWDMNSCPADQDLGALTTMASWPGAKLSLGRLLYIAPSSTASVLHFGIEKYRLPWCRLSGKWVAKQMSLPVTHAKLRAFRSRSQTVSVLHVKHDMIMSGSTLYKDLTLFSLSASAPSWSTQGIQTHVLLIRC